MARGMCELAEKRVGKGTLWPWILGRLVVVTLVDVRQVHKTLPNDPSTADITDTRTHMHWHRPPSSTPPLQLVNRAHRICDGP